MDIEWAGADGGKASRGVQLPYSGIRPWYSPGFLADDAAGIPLAPDWVCEVLSPSTASVDRAKKLPIYWREGVGHAWLIDPTAHTLEVFRRHDLGWLLVASHEGASVVHAEPFDAIALDLAGLWVD